MVSFLLLYPIGGGASEASGASRVCFNFQDRQISILMKMEICPSSRVLSAMKTTLGSSFWMQIKSTKNTFRSDVLGPGGIKIGIFPSFVGHGT